MADVGAFEKDTTYRLLVEACRNWIVTWWLAHKSLPQQPAIFWIYGNGATQSMDWGNSPGPDRTDDFEYRPLRRKRIKVTIEIEDH